MSVRAIHFKTIRSNIVRPLCQRAGVVCSWSNSSQSRHEVTCKLCLKRMMDTAAWAAQCKADQADIAQEQA
jgi:hypothetical protein